MDFVRNERYIIFRHILHEIDSIDLIAHLWAVLWLHVAGVLKYHSDWQAIETTFCAQSHVELQAPLLVRNAVVLHRYLTSCRHNADGGETESCTLLPSEPHCPVHRSISPLRRVQAKRVTHGAHVSA